MCNFISLGKVWWESYLYLWFITPSSFPTALPIYPSHLSSVSLSFTLSLPLLIPYSNTNLLLQSCTSLIFPTLLSSLTPLSSHTAQYFIHNTHNCNTPIYITHISLDPSTSLASTDLQVVCWSTLLRADKWFLGNTSPENQNAENRDRIGQSCSLYYPLILLITTSPICISLFTSCLQSPTIIRDNCWPLFPAASLHPADSSECPFSSGTHDSKTGEHEWAQVRSSHHTEGVGNVIPVFLHNGWG